MKVATGKVVAGKVVVEDVALTEGATVTIIAPEDCETFELGPTEEAALIEAIAEANRGDVVSSDDLLRKLSS